MNNHVFIKLLTTFGLLLISYTVQAGCSGGAYNYSATIATQTISVPRNKVTGPIGNTISITPNGSSRSISCSGGATYSHLKFSDAVPMELSSTAGVYKTNVDGIGIKVWSNFSGSVTVDNLIKRWYLISNSSSYSGGAWLTNIVVQYYIIGPVSTGTVSFPSGIVVQAWANTATTTSGGVNYNTLTMRGTATVKVAACKTPDIKVDLGKHSRSDFANLNATSAATPFTFAINDCDPKMNSVHYTFKPAPGITVGGTGANQHITLDSSSTARGFGIQVLYDSGAGNTLVPLNTKTKFTGYSTSATTTRSYTIPMKARFIRTASNAADVSGGSASSAIEFTMSYE